MNTCVRENLGSNETLLSKSHACKKLAMKNYLRDIQTFEGEMLNSYLNNYV